MADPHEGGGDNNHLHEDRGELRALTDAERDRLSAAGFNGPYKFLVTSSFKLTWNGETVTVPAGFASDGATGAPDYGTSWLYHDYLYTTHCFDSGAECTRADADRLMSDLLAADRMRLYCWAFTAFARLNPFCIMSRAWESNGARGPEFLPDE